MFSRTVENTKRIGPTPTALVHMAAGCSDIAFGAERKLDQSAAPILTRQHSQISVDGRRHLCPASDAERSAACATDVDDYTSRCFSVQPPLPELLLWRIEMRLCLNSFAGLAVSRASTWPITTPVYNYCASTPLSRCPPNASCL